VASGKSRDIRGAVEKLLSTLAKTLDKGKQVQSQDAEEGEYDSEDVENYEAYEELEDFGPSTSGTKNLDILNLQRDFIDAVGSGYRPGLIRFGADDFVLSVSIPVITLAADIPPRALVAWDRRLLSRSRHLTLLINGWRGTYPILRPDGTLNYEAVKNGASMQFKVGLSKRYKPGKEQAYETSRNFGLIVEEADDQLSAHQPSDPDDIFFLDDPPMLMKGKGKEEQEEDDGLFEKFSLSSSLESLLDQALLRLIQMRKKFGLGWAGAEMLLSLVEKSQTIPEEIFHLQKKVLPAVLSLMPFI
jgi:ubiquitin-conjugating enzyme E2 Q